MKLIKIEDGVITTLIQTNDPSFVPQGEYFDVTQKEELHDIEKINQDFDVSLKKDKQGKIEQITLSKKVDDKLKKL